MLALVITSVIWAFSFGLIKHHLAGIDPCFVSFVRLALSALVFLPWLRRDKSAKGVAKLLALGALQFGAMYVLYLFAFQWLLAYEVALLTIVTPIWVCVSDGLLNRRLILRPFLAAAVATVGTAIVLGGRGIGNLPWAGILLIQASNACFALGQVLYRRMREQDDTDSERSLFGLLYLGGALLTLPLAWHPLAGTFMQLTLTQWVVLLYLGVIASGVGFFLWNHGSTQVSTGLLAVMNNAKTPLGLLVSLLVFNESVHIVRLMIGGAIVVFATVYARK